MYIVFNNKSIRSYINIYILEISATIKSVFVSYLQVVSWFNAIFRIHFIYMSAVACQTGGPIWLHFLNGTPKVAKADFFIGNFGNSTSAGKRQE